MKYTCWKKVWGRPLLALACVSLTTLISAQPIAPPIEPVSTNAVPDTTELEPTATVSNVIPTETIPPTEPATGKRHQRIQPVVAIWDNAELKAGHSAEAVFAIMGSAIARGEVRETVVAVAGDVIVSGTVDDAVFAVLGNVTIEPGARVDGDVVAIGGDLKIGDGAVIEGEVVSIGGRADVSETATLSRHVQQIPIPGLRSLRSFLVECVFKLRPLAPQVGALWIITGILFLLYLLVAIVMRRPVDACVRELNRRPATTFFVGLLALVLIPLIIAVLAATGIGLIVIPFVLAALLFGALIGKVAFLEFFGHSVVNAVSSAKLKPVLALLLGGVILTLLYMVPVLGLISFMIAGTWSLGGAVVGLLGSARREMPTNPTPPSSTPPTQPVTNPIIPSATNLATAATPENASPTTESPFDAGGGNAPFSAATARATLATAPSADAWAYPRAGFWERMGAGFLDMVLVGILARLAGPFWFVVVLAYFAGMWAWKGTTVGGVVLNLKVTRLDNQPVTLLVALVRTLAAAFSTIVLFLGFLWIAWDKDRQAWHDKIAGTVVVRLPRGTPLVCL